MKFTVTPCTVLFSLAWATQLVACGSNTNSASGLQTDITQPSSPMQSSLSAASDSLAASASESGSVSSPDVSSSQQTAMMALAAGCVAVTTNPSPLDPNNLPETFSISWTYTNCVRSVRGGTLNGTRAVSVTLNPNGSTVAETFALTRDYVNGADLTADGNGNVVSTGSRSSGSVTRQVTGDGNRVFTGPLGNERFNHTYQHTLSVADTFTQDANAFALAQRVINGQGQLNHNLIDAVTMTDFNNITYQPANCTWPVSGVLSVSTTFAGGRTEAYAYSWGSPCGTVTVLQGTTVTQTVSLPDAP